MIRIRPAALRDAVDIPSIGLTLGYETSPPVGTIGVILDDPAQTIIVAADEDDQAIGWIHAVIVRRAASAPFAELVGLAVREEYRRQGIATQLVDAAAEWASAARGIDRLRTRVNILRSDGLAFYDHAGFTEQKRQVVMERPLRRDSRSSS